MEFDKEEQQIVYDALIHYLHFAEEMSKSNHVANEVFHDISDKTLGLIVKVRESWPGLVY